MKPHRYLKIDGLDFFVFDGLLEPSAVSSIEEDLRNASFNSRNSSNANSRKYREWANHIPVEKFSDHPVGKTAASALNSLFPDVAFEFWDVHCNSTAFGDWAFAHRDSNEAGAYSALYYVNRSWNRDWFGETIFYQNEEPVVSVSVRPGRLVVFDGRIQHRAGVPAMNCPAERLTLSLRYQADHIGECRLILNPETV